MLKPWSMPKAFSRASLSSLSLTEVCSEVMTNRDSWGHSHFTARGEMIGLQRLVLLFIVLFRCLCLCCSVLYRGLQRLGSRALAARSDAHRERSQGEASLSCVLDASKKQKPWCPAVCLMWLDSKQRLNKLYIYIYIEREREQTTYANPVQLSGC